MPRDKRLPRHIQDALKEQALRGNIREPDLAKMFAHFFDICGGERSVATLLYGEFTNAKEGSMTRQRLLDMIVRGLARLASKQTEDDDLGVLSEEDLERELLELADGVETDAEDSDQPAGPEPEAG